MSVCKVVWVSVNCSIACCIRDIHCALIHALPDENCGTDFSPNVNCIAAFQFDDIFCITVFFSA